MSKMKKCQLCNAKAKELTNCMTCDEQTIMQAKVKKVMGEFKRHQLHSGSKTGPIVTKRDQAIAIALHEGRKAAKIVIKKKK